MKHISAQNTVNELLQMAGITINGKEPYDIQVNNNKLYSLVLREGEMGLGNSYVEGWWDCAHLDEFFCRVMSARLHEKITSDKKLLLKMLLGKLINFQSKKRAWIVGEKHYDLGDTLYSLMLESNMVYTCAYWKNASNLEEAQQAKLDLICKKLQLKPGMRLLDIGCGWGSLAKYAAENYGVSVVGATISRKQYEHAKQNYKGLPIDIRLQDYRDLEGQFDRVSAIGLMEHVGHSNYRTLMQVVNRCLTDDGIFVLHTIGNGGVAVPPDPWMSKYIFPNFMLPSIPLIGKAAEGLFIMEDWHNFGADYDKTLVAWQRNFEKHWPTLKSHYDEHFFRRWNYYLLSCAGSFRARYIQLWQVVFSKKGIKGGYQAPR